MNKKPETLLVRTLSVLIAAASMHVYIQETENTPAALHPAYGDRKLRKYEIMNQYEYKVPAYDRSIVSLFPEKPPPEKTDENQKNEVFETEPPVLLFIGVVETEQGRTYSFKKKDTGKIMFLKEGESSGGIMLFKVEKDRFIMKMKDKEFTVVRQ